MSRYWLTHAAEQQEAASSAGERPAQPIIGDENTGVSGRTALRPLSSRAGSEAERGGRPSRGASGGSGFGVSGPGTTSTHNFQVHLTFPHTGFCRTHPSLSAVPTHTHMFTTCLIV